MIWLWLLAACAPLRPHERAVLQSPVMQTAGDPLEAACMEHTHRIREGMVGATGVGGASCGCN